MNNIFEALPDTPYVFINWTSNSQVFNPNDSTALVTVNLNASDSIVAHFDFNTPVFGITNDQPVANVYPTVVSDFTQLDFSLPQAMPVYIQLMDINGKQIRVLANGEYMQRGFHSMKLSIPTGSLLEGMYLLQFRAGGSAKTFKLIVAGR